MDTCLDKWICKDRNHGTWHFWSLKPRSLRDGYNILQLFIYAVMVHCDSMHLGILRLYLEWLGHLATYGRAFPKSWQIIQKHGESRKNKWKYKGNDGNEGFCGAPCMSAHLGFGPRAAAQRKGGRGTSISALPNGRSGLAARPQPPEVARYLILFDGICPGHLTSLDSEQFSCPRGGRTKRCIHLIVCGESHKWIRNMELARDGTCVKQND